MSTSLLIATNNPGKRREIQAILADLPLKLVLPVEIGLNLEVEETGHTYQENAVLKALAFARASGLPSLADDSGLEVEVLGGEPGVRSARYAPIPHATDADRRAYLLERLRPYPVPNGLPGWPARFRCVVALALPEGDIYLAEGTCPGFIITHERGQHGFGYDPIFYLPDYNQTMAELPPEVKNRISHRARALQAARPFLQRLLNLSSGNPIP
ncbi:MAG: RdgB/HAM1 family non-canonical purine NTP pyrophosphatase [Thermanaerothrix sp.]|nr:RdgB/HAM1 family non-canonical purine NTP pyrophosphatase [Thermanaerothrix sp.]